MLIAVNIVLIIVLIALLFGLAAVSFVKWQVANGRMFCYLPKNHAACVVVKGRLVHYLMHREDEQEFKRLGGTGKVVARNENEDPLVNWFNLHLMCWNPLATLKPVHIIKSNTSARSEKEKQTPFLMLQWPRLTLTQDIELVDRVKINVLTEITEVQVMDLDKIYFKFDGFISKQTDDLTSSILVRELANKDLAAFQVMYHQQKTPPFSLTQTFKAMASFESIGITINGKVVLVSYNVIPDANAERAEKAIAEQQLVALENKTKIERANADKNVTEIQAAADATGIKLRGAAAAEAAEALKQAIGEEGAAAVEKAKNLPAGLTTLVEGGTSRAVSPIIGVGGAK